MIDTAERRARERHSLADALLECTGPHPLSREQIYAAARHEWGPASDALASTAFRELVDAQLVAWDGTGWVLATGKDRP